LQLWLDAVNGLPAEDPIGLWLLSNDILDSWAAQLTGKALERERKIRELRERAAQWGHPAVAHVFRTDTDTPEPGQRLSELLSARETFQGIAKFAASHRVFDRVESIPNSLGTSTRVVSDHGVLRVEMSPFLKMLDGIDIDRLRLCPICQKLFWAGRRDKAACSGLCAGNLRIRKLRQNREYRKKHPKQKIKEKSNG
jgi:hypothetical protein